MATGWQHEPCRTRGDCYHARGGCSSGHIAVESGYIASLGRIQGRKSVESGQLIRIAAKGGRAAVESGHLASVSAKGGRKNAESGHIATLGRIQGRKNVESGYLVFIAAKGGRAAVESGQLARISKGVPSTADGILFRSQTEAMFYCVAQEFGGEPRANPPRIDLSDGHSYFPDFVLGRSILGIPANIPIELKPARNAYYQKNIPKAIEAGAVVVYWDELVEN